MGFQPQAWIEKGKSNPMIPLYLFKNRTFAGANLLTFLLYTGLGAAMLFLSLNLIQVQGYRQLQAGMVMLPFTVILASFARWAGSLTDRYGPRWLLVFGSLCVCLWLRVCMGLLLLF